MQMIDEIDHSEFSYVVHQNKYELILCPFYKLLLKYPAKLMKVILQFGDLYFFIEMLSFTIEFFLILLTSTARFHIVCIIICFILFFLFSFLFGNVLSIPLWEFVQFRWLNNLNVLQTIFNIFECRISNQKLEIIDFITNLLVGIFFYLYFYFCFSGNPNFDDLNLTVLLIIPGIKCGLNYICYLVRAIQSIFWHDSFHHDDNRPYEDPFVLAMQMPKDLFHFIKLIFSKCCNKCSVNRTLTKKQLFFITVKEIGFLFGIIYLVFMKFHFDIKPKYIVIPIFICLYNSIISLSIDMPIWIFNVFDRWDYFRIIKADQGINGSLRRNMKFKGFKYVNSICNFIMPVMIIAYIVLHATFQKGSFEPISAQTLWNGELTHAYDNNKEDIKITSPMCEVEIYHLNLIQIGSIAAASYYNDTDLTMNYLKNSFFRDEKVKIKKIEYAVKDEKHHFEQLKYDNHPVLLRADFDIENSSRGLTVFAVRGSTTSLDWWLDIEIFLASALLSVAKWIPILQSYESSAAKKISEFMTLPLSHMVNATLTYDYTKDMFNALDYFYSQDENKQRIVIFTGHSLGGGLSKILANKYGIQSVSFSGPGISPIEDKYKHVNYDEFFKAKFIDIIPDNDFVPRFEISGGTKFRVLCEKNGGECHSILRTICQIGLSCNLEYYTGDFCRGRYSKDEYEGMINLALGK